MLNPSSTTQTAPTISPPAAQAKTGALIHLAEPADSRRCLATLTRAFESDPVCNWIWPDRRHYLSAFPRIARAFGGAAIDLGTAHYYDGFAGVALWLPPGSAPDEDSLVKAIEETTAEERLEATFSLFEQMSAWHPGEPHWRLPLIGVDPAFQGQGIGSALLRHALDQCDRQRIPAYLEATSPNNVRLYRRHGFKPLGVVRAADSPPIIPMVRKPR